MQRALGWGLVVGALVFSRPASAQGQDDPAVRDAQARFEEGLDRVKTGDFEGARISFAQAYAALKRPAILWNLALAEEKTGHLVEALSHFKRVVRDKSAATGDRDEAQRHAVALTGRIGHIDVQAPPGSTVHLDGDAAEVVVPLLEPLDVTPGRHAVDVRLGSASRTIAIDAPAGQVVRVTLSSADLAQGGGAASPSTVTPTSTVGTNPSQERAAEGAESPPAHEGSAPIPPARIITVTVLGGAALIATGLGVFLALESQDHDGSSRGYRNLLGQNGKNNVSACSGAVAVAASMGKCSALNSSVGDQDLEALWSKVLYVTAGALAAGAIVTWFVWPKSKRSEGAWVAPILAPGTYGIGAGGHF